MGSDDPFEEYIATCNNWGKWENDHIGTANYTTRNHVLAASKLVKTGRVVPLSLLMDANGPQTGANGRFNCLRYSVATGTDAVMGGQQVMGGPLPRKMGYADDVVHFHLQSSTHWDSLCHVFHDGKGFNGRPAELVTASGAQHHGAEHLRGSLVGRGVLLDMPRVKGVDSLDDGYAITIDDLEEALETQKVEIGEGDIMLVRTGQLHRCKRDGWGTYAGGDAPGLSFFTAPWLHEKKLAAVASDTWGVEVRPNELPDSLQPLHVPTLVYMGLLLGEMFDFDELADACANAGSYEMLITAPPLPFTGSAGAPPGPVAIL